MKFTAGPWEAQPEKLMEGKHHVAGETPRIVKGKVLIARACRQLDARIRGGRDDEAEANAILIAAAPALLEVLQIIATQGGDIVEPWAAEKARVAIAQATGVAK